MKIFDFLNRQKSYAVVFALCFSYWIYLVFNSEMVIHFDAVGYEHLGRMIYEQGWGEFFRTGPHREPLYPSIIALSMGIAEVLSINYQWVQKIFQIMILFVTQIILLGLLGRAHIHKNLKLATIFYLGFSPAIVNSAFSLYSEIVTYPFVLLIVLFGYSSWRAIHCDKLRRVILFGILTALSFTGATFAKGIFQYCFLAFLVPFVIVTFCAMVKKNKRVCINGIAYLMITFAILNVSVLSYRFTNKKFNGNFEFTNRYDVNLYGTAAKRTNAMSPELFMAHIASIPGGGVCRKFFDEQTCLYPTFHYMDHFRAQLPVLLSNTPPGEVQSKTISLAFDQIWKEPGQYFLLTTLESLKMGFWESTQIGSVAYPPPFKKLFIFKPFKDGLRFTISILTYFSLFYLVVWVCRNRLKLCDFSSGDNTSTCIGFFILLVVIPFTGLYAIFSILTRFALPIATLYVLCIALTAQNIFFGNINFQRAPEGHVPKGEDLRL